MGKKAKQKGRKRERRQEADLAIAGAATAVSGTAGGAAVSGQGARTVGPLIETGPDSPEAGLWSPRPSSEVAARLASIGTVLGRQLARADTGDGLSRARLSALSLLVLGGPRTLGELAAAEGVRPPTMTRLVRAMEADGLLERHPNPADGRSIIIAATADGVAQLDVGRSRQLGPLTESIEALGDDALLALDEAAELIARLLREVSWDAQPRP
jgi:DNA-binding MarR family transcriptional regulator